MTASGHNSEQYSSNLTDLPVVRASSLRPEIRDSIWGRGLRLRGIILGGGEPPLSRASEVRGVFGILNISHKYGASRCIGDCENMGSKAAESGKILREERGGPDRRSASEARGAQRIAAGDLAARERTDRRKGKRPAECRRAVRRILTDPSRSFTTVIGIRNHAMKWQTPIWVNEDYCGDADVGVCLSRNLLQTREPTRNTVIARRPRRAEWRISANPPLPDLTRNSNGPRYRVTSRVAPSRIPDISAGFATERCWSNTNIKKSVRLQNT
jgi:hypothetical protein